VSERLEDLRHRWAVEPAESAELDGVVDVDDWDVDDELDDEDAPVDPEAAIPALRAEPDDDQPSWRSA
jgi:hypothetical protein